MAAIRPLSSPLRSAALFCALAMCGCASVETPPLFLEPGPPESWNTGGVTVSPAQVTAPIGSEVILIASMSDRAGQPASDHRVEWMLSAGSVGQFVTLGDRDVPTFFGLLGPSPRKVNNSYAIGNTSARNLILTRGTPTTADDIRLGPGQTWISVTSPIEGVSEITVFGPDVYAWDQRQRSATIRWVAATAMPVAPGAIPNSPPGAGIPPSLPANMPALPIAPATGALPPRTTAPATTAAASPLDVHITGSDRADVGSDVQYTINVTNHSAAAATGLMVSDHFDAGLKHAVSTGPLERPLDDIAPGQSRQFNISFRVAQPGQWCHTVEVTSREGNRATARACVVASAAPIASQARLKIEKTGPKQIRAGEVAQFFIAVTNTGNGPLTNLRLSDTYDDNLEPVQASDGFQPGSGELTWTIDQLAVGQTIRRQVNCRGRRVGRSSNRVTITDGAGNTAADEASVDILPGA